MIDYTTDSGLSRGDRLNMLLSHGVKRGNSPTILADLRLNNVQSLDQLCDYQDIISKNEKIVLEFYNERCLPCQTTLTMMSELAGKYKDVLFVAIDVDKYPNLRELYNIKHIPFIIVYRSGKIGDSLVGSVSKDTLVEFINRNLNSS